MMQKEVSGPELAIYYKVCGHDLRITDGDQQASSGILVGGGEQQTAASIDALPLCDHSPLTPLCNRQALARSRNLPLRWSKSEIKDRGIFPTESLRALNWD